MEIILNKEERMKILEERLRKTVEKATEYYNFAEAAAICGETSDEVKYRNAYYTLSDEADKIKKVLIDEGKKED